MFFKNKKIIVAITGASGIIYGIRLVEELINKAKIYLIISKVAEAVAKYEEVLNRLNKIKEDVEKTYSERDLESSISSSSFNQDAMIIAPCSMKTLAGIASGYAENLILRAADNTLRLKKPLILVIRETPLNTIQIQNMLKVALAGAIIMPAAPAFYHKPKTIDDLVDFIVGKVLDVLGYNHKLYEKWSNH